MLRQVIDTTFEELGARLQALAPNLLAMLLLLLTGIVIAGAVRYLLGWVLPRLGVDRLAAQAGVHAGPGFGGRPARSVSVVLSLGFAWLVLAAFVLLAVAALDVRVAMDLLTRAFVWLPHLLVSLVLLLGGFLVAAFVRRGVLIAAVNAGLGSARLLAALAHAGVLVLFVAMALEQVGLGTRVVLVAFAILFGGIVLALALAFGLAGRDFARDALASVLRRREPPEDDGLRHL